MSNRRAQDERIEGTPDGVNAITEIVDVPDAPTIGTATAGFGSASVAFTPATTGGTVSLFTATSNPGSITGTSATSPITVSGLTGGTAYTFTVRGANSTGTGPSSSASNSVTPVDLPGAYDALADITVPSGGAASITFVGIPTGYKHLQLRALYKCSNTSGTIRFRTGGSSINTGTNYNTHNLYGNGSSAAAANFGGAAADSGFLILAGQDTFNYALVLDFLDYQNTNKNKTMRYLNGGDNNGSGIMGLGSILWAQTTAIETISLYTQAGTFSEYSSFALYGVK